MKKYLVALLTLVFLFSFSTVAMAEVADKSASLTLTASAYSVQAGQSVTFTARTLKQGSNYLNPTWSINGVPVNETLDIDTTTFADDYYTTTISIPFNTPGTYNVSVNIIMSAGKGKSDVQFVATQTVTINVGAVLTSAKFNGSDNIFDTEGESLVLTFNNNVHLNGEVSVVTFDGTMEIQSNWLPFTTDGNTLTIYANRDLSVPRTNMTGNKVIRITGLYDDFGDPVAIPLGGVEIQ